MDAESTWSFTREALRFNVKYHTKSKDSNYKMRNKKADSLPENFGFIRKY